MMEGVLGLAAAVLLALIFRSWRELNARNKELKTKLRRRQKMEEELQSATEAMAMSLEDLAAAIAKADDEIADRQAELNLREQRLDALKAREPFDIVVFDRLALTVDNLWEVDVSNPQIGELAAAKLAPQEFQDRWREGRCFLVAGSTEEDAAKRCAARFPSSLGYRIDGIRRYRGMAMGAPAAMPA